MSRLPSSQKVADILIKKGARIAASPLQSRKN
jgi:hypothetical protein